VFSRNKNTENRNGTGINRSLNRKILHGPAGAFERKPTVSEFNPNYIWLADLLLQLEIKQNITLIVPLNLST
jgi:hypothetical protein